MARGISGTAVGVTVGGFVLLYSAIKNVTITSTVRSFLAGQPIAGGGNPFATQTSASGGSGGGGLPAVTSGTVVNQVRDSLMSKFGKSGAAAVMGNIEHESGFDPTNDTGDGGTSGGLCQWHAGRFSALQHYAAVRGLPWQSVQAQLGYLYLELAAGYQDVGLVLIGPGSVASKTAYFAKRFEACTECYSASTAEVQGRIASAEAFYAGMNVSKRAQ